MSDVKLLERQSAVYQMGLLFNQSPSEDKILAYAKALMNYEPKQIIFAFNQVILSGSAFFPSLAEILGHLKPKQDTSEEIGNFVANEVIQKVIDLGYYRLNEVYENLSTISKLAIGENRYILSEIASSDMDQLPTIRAQLRNMAKSAAEMAKSEKKNTQLEKIGIVLEMKKPELMKMDYSQFLPKDLA